MARPLRIEFPNAFYHVMSRGNNRQNIFLNDADREIFLETLRETVGLFGVRAVAFCLMPNHYHLLLTTPKANLSRAMRHLNGVYTQRFNRRHRKDGHLFRGRYKAILVQEDRYLTHLIRYIHLNPVQGNLTQDLASYPWTSHKSYLKAKDEEPWLFVRLGLSFFATKPNKALSTYRQFMEEGVDLKTKSFFEKKNQSSILGEQDFLDDVKEKYLFSDPKLSTEIPEKRKINGNAKADNIIKEVTRSFAQRREAVYTSKRGESNQARLVAMVLTRELSGLNLTEVAKLFKINSYKTVSSNCYRLKARMFRDPVLKNKYSQVYQTCSQAET